MHINVPAAPRRLIRLPQVKHLTGISRSTIYALISQGQFPAGVKLGPRAVAWVEEEVREWIDATISVARGACTTGERSRA